VKLAPVEVADLTERIRAKAEAMADREWVVAELAHGIVNVDADRVTQAMLQLAANAVAYGEPAGGRIELGSELDGTAPDELGGELHPATGGGLLRLWVRDFGPGIPLDAQKRIFERFQRGPSIHGRGPGGSGLGLAIVSGIAAAHGGHVTVDSRPGEGATFTIILPVTMTLTPPTSPRKGTT
jgi:signal transduction histidine kinase